MKKAKKLTALALSAAMLLSLEAAAQTGAITAKMRAMAAMAQPITRKKAKETLPATGLSH